MTAVSNTLKRQRPTPLKFRTEAQGSLHDLALVFMPPRSLKTPLRMPHLALTKELLGCAGMSSASHLPATLCRSGCIN